jgi:hypothetical protein
MNPPKTQIQANPGKSREIKPLVFHGLLYPTDIRLFSDLYPTEIRPNPTQSG